MTAHGSTPMARIHDLPDLLGLIPHLLGFHPDESLVVMVVVDGQVEVTARVDLVDLTPAAHLELLLDRLLLRWPRANLWLVAYSAVEAGAWSLLRRAVAHLGDALAGAPMCVSRGRYRTGDERGPSHPHDPASTQSAATATVAGLQARPSRAMLRRSVQVDPDDAAAAEAAWVAALQRLSRVDEQQLPSEMAEALSRQLRQPFGVPRTELAWLAALAQVPDARDRALVAITRVDAEAHVELWSRVVRGCPYGTQQQALALLGMAAWVSGDGALQTICLEELEQQGAHLPLQQLLEDLNQAIVPPSYWDELRPTLLEAIRPLAHSEVGTDQAARGVGEAHGQGADHQVA